MKDIKNTLERADINQANRDDNAGEGCECNVFKGLHGWLSMFGFDVRHYTGFTRSCNLFSAI